MDQKRRGRLDFFQNIAIVLLALSAVFLFAQTQLYSLGSDAGEALLHDLLDGGGTVASGTAAETAASFPAPVRVAVTGVYGGRYGNVAMTTADAAFEPLGSLLREALGSAQSFAACDVRQVLAALNGTSIYWDFLEPLPLGVLAELLGSVAPEDDTVSVRRVVLSGEESGPVELYLWGQNCFRCVSAVPAAEFTQIVDSYEFNGAMFAMDDEALSALDSSSLLPTEIPELPVLSASVSLPDTEILLAALGFYPRTNSRYPEANGTEVITEGSRILRVSAGGTVRYSGGWEESLVISAMGETPTISEAVSGTEALLSKVLAPYMGEAGLYLQSVRQAGEEIVLRFGYQLGGVPIRFSDGTPAAEITLSGKAVSALTLRFRRYAAAGEGSLLLPLRQALAIAVSGPGTELSIGYADGGADVIKANWLMDAA